MRFRLGKTAGKVAYIGSVRQVKRGENSWDARSEGSGDGHRINLFSQDFGGSPSWLETECHLTQWKEDTVAKYDISWLCNQQRN